jgi:sulfur dioxygenase
MMIRQLFDHESSTYTYVIADAARGVAALVDPVLEQVERDLTLLEQMGLRLVAVLETHVHADHVTAAGVLRERTGATTYGSALGAPCIDVGLADGETVRVGEVVVTAVATPGHTDDGMSFLVPGAVFTGDTLLVRGCGRSDFQNGNAGQLYDSVTGKLFTLPDATVVYPGHDYKGHTSSTIGEEKRFNARLAGRDRAAFIELMGSLGLPPPKKLDIAVPANRACGTPRTTHPEVTMNSTNAASLFQAGTPVPAGYRDISPSQLRAALGHVRMIDVREPDELVGELGRIEGVEPVPLATVSDRAHAWSKEAEIVMVCRSGNRSGKAAAALVAAGFQRVMNLAGGMLAYTAAGFPVIRN